MKDLGIVSGDLVYVISNCRPSDSTATDQKSQSVMACSSDCGSVVNSGVTEMESETIRENCTEAAINVNGDGDKATECGKTPSNVSDVDLTVSEMQPESTDNFTDNKDESVTETESTGVPYAAMSAEELQLVNRYLTEPMVVREATDDALPQTLVLSYSLIQPQTADAAVLTVLDVLMSELGYQRTTVGCTEL